VEHRLFLLAEVLLTVVHLQRRVVRNLKGKERKKIEGNFEEVIKQLRSVSESIATDSVLPMNLRDYTERVHKLAQPSVADEKGGQHAD
jgi:hypothetical protein